MNLLLSRISDVLPTVGIDKSSKSDGSGYDTCLIVRQLVHGQCCRGDGRDSDLTIVELPRVCVGFVDVEILDDDDAGTARAAIDCRVVA
jgi:hypothetical protein